MPYYIFVLLFFLSACHHGYEVNTSEMTPAMKNSSLTQGNIQQLIKKGITTKNDVLEAFGAPNVTTLNDEGHEVWTYQRSAQTSQSISKKNSFAALFAGGTKSHSGFENNSRMITLMLTFDEKGRVIHFKSRSSHF